MTTTYSLLCMAVVADRTRPSRETLRTWYPLFLISAICLFSAPLFFAGLIFSGSLRHVGETSRSLASNLTGSVAGGVLEYGAMLWGIKSLYLLAGAIYAAAFAAFLAKRE